MQTLKHGVDSLSLIANLTLDRFLFVGALGVALFMASYLITL
ncbi:MAG: hypothetical protein ABJN52_00670 [Litorimonas sp.]